MNVEKTKKLNLCVSCEACSAVCPSSAIEMKFKSGQYLPDINKNKCTDCSLCQKICPGIDLKDHILEKKFNVNENAGHCKAACIVNYAQEEIRKNGASGGVVTGLLLEMLRNQDIDGAFVLNSDGTEGKIARVSYVEKEKDIVSSAKSKYIPASVYEIIRKIKEEPEKKYAIVGTPCQFSGIKKFLQNFNIKNDNIIFFGLFCDRTLNYNILEYFKDASGNNGRQLNKVDFRNKEKKGWPGDIKLYFKDERELFLDRTKRMEVKDYFQLNRCLFCLDKLNKSADISFGDCYIKGQEDKKGKSVVIVRTEKGKIIFEKFKDKFSIKDINPEEIINSQKLQEKSANFERVKNFSENRSFDSRKLKIFIGSNYPATKIFLKISLLVEKNFRKMSILLRLVLAGIKVAFEIIKHSLGYVFGKLSPAKNKKMENVIILGGGMGNKGAQAMTFTVIDQIRRKSPGCKIYILSSESFNLPEGEKNKYNFEILPWSIFEQLSVFFNSFDIFKKYNANDKYKKSIKNAIVSADCIFDVSGYALSSQRGIFPSLSYILNIIIARKFSKPLYLLPQSFGPYEYGFLSNIIMKPLLFLYLKYPVKIFAREEDGYQKTLHFTDRNIEKSLDLVIQNKEYFIENIFSEKYDFRKIDIKNNSVGIVPNTQVVSKMKWPLEEFYELYRNLISELIGKNKNVYIIRHSSEDDEINNKIKEFFLSNENVVIINENLNAIELECIINQLDYVVASRYHSVVHAYKNGIPAIVIGWAVKYKELLEAFGQQEYLFDCRNNLEKADFIKKVLKLENCFVTEREKIKLKAKEIASNSIYNKIF